MDYQATESKQVNEMDTEAQRIREVVEEHIGKAEALDCLAAIVDAWRRLRRAGSPLATKTFRDLLERDEALERTLEVGRRLLEKEGRL